MNLNKITNLIKELDSTFKDSQKDIFKLAKTPESMGFAMGMISKINQAVKNGSREDLEKLKNELETLKK